MYCFLNAVMNEFIQKAEHLPGMRRAFKFAKEHRAIGLGVLGYHSLFQSKLIEFESLEAKQINHDVFSTLKKEVRKHLNGYMKLKVIHVLEKDMLIQLLWL